MGNSLLLKKWGWGVVDKRLGWFQEMTSVSNRVIFLVGRAADRAGMGARLEQRIQDLAFLAASLRRRLWLFLDPAIILKYRVLVFF